MIPTSNLDNIQIEEVIETTRTYKVIDNSVSGYIDDLEALQQAINNVLNTEKYEYPIYSFDYGIELENLLGKDLEYIKIELKRRIEDCLLEDERIISVSDFSFNQDEDSLYCSFNVISIYGEISIDKEVDI